MEVTLLVPELPPRIDRASKPALGMPPSTPGSSLPSRNSSSLNSGGTLGRSAQERLFGNAAKALGSAEDQQDDLYTATNKLLNTMEPKKIGSNGNSLERRDLIHAHHHHHQNPQNSLDRQKNGYDSVSSYDSYNNNQTQQAITTSTSSLQNRLGPNAPDDLKSVPPPVAQNRTSIVNSQDYGQRTSMHEREYSFNDPMAAPRNSVPQRPTNLLIESPRKPHVIETKTDYGKYR